MGGAPLGERILREAFIWGQNRTERGRDERGPSPRAPSEHAHLRRSRAVDSTRSSLRERLSSAAMETLVSDSFVDFALYDVLDAIALTTLPSFADHSRETFDLVMANARKLAREVL